jgi:hypothetical protein
MAETAAGAGAVAADPYDGVRSGELPAGGILARVRSLSPDLTGALRRVAEQVIADPPGAARATIVELAERSGTSPATVTRFCRHSASRGTPTCASASRRRPAGPRAPPAGLSTLDARSSPATRWSTY